MDEPAQRPDALAQPPDNRRIPLPAALSLVSGALVFVLLSDRFGAAALGTAILALACAHIARYLISRDPYSFKGAWMTLPGLAVGYGVLALFVLTLPELGRREKMRRICCAAHLNAIGLVCRQYATDHGGAFPPDFQTLARSKYLDAFKIYLCPAVEDAQSATRADELASPEHCGFLYFGRGLTQDRGPDPGMTVLACDRTGNHKGFWNIVFADGRVRGFSGDDLAVVVRRERLILSVAEPAAR